MPPKLAEVHRTLRRQASSRSSFSFCNGEKCSRPIEKERLGRADDGIKFHRMFPVATTHQEHQVAPPVTKDAHALELLDMHEFVSE